MKNTSKWLRVGSLGLLLCLIAPVASADQVTLTLTGSGLVSWGGQYVSPYAATIKPAGSSTSSIVDVVCLDVLATTYTSTPYQYDRTYDSGPVSSLADYQAAARLAAELLNGGLSTTERGLRAWAVWYVFAGDSAWTKYSGSEDLKDDIVALASAARNSNTSVSFTVYTPISSSTQRFMSHVSVPEPSAVAQLGLNLGGLLCLVVVLRRRIVRG